jgi:hypothetical protein
MDSACSTHREEEKSQNILQGSLKEIDRLEELGVD